MSLTFENENYTSAPWAESTTQFAQSNEYAASFNFLHAQWPEHNLGDMDMSLSNGYGRLAQYNAAAVAPLSSPNMTSETSSSPSTDNDKNDLMQKPSRGPGRPKRDTNGNAQAAKDRRRVQVRLAQQAYRHRKEATLLSLRTESSDLKARLQHFEKACDNLFQVIERAILQPEDIGIAQRVNEEVNRYRLPINLSEERANIENCDTSTSDSEDKTQGSKIDRKHEGPSKPNHRATSRILDVTRRSSNVAVSHPPQDNIESRKTIYSNQSLWNYSQPLFRPLEDLDDASLPLPFSIRFRNHALKRGYNLITTQETSYSMLCRAFRHSIFSSTREDILKHIQLHLHESTMTAYQALSIIRTGSSIVPGPKYLGPLPPHTTPSYSGNSSSIFSTSGEESIKGSQEGIEEYIDADGVEKYLSERGLSITPGSDIVSLPLGSRKIQTAAPTLFDEIRSSQPLKLSVGKLIEELLDRIVCLGFGPGIRPQEVDEAIRSTIIAAI